MLTPNLTRLLCAVNAQPGTFANPYAPQFDMNFSVEGSDYLFTDDKTKGRTWGEKIFYATGTSYLLGMYQLAGLRCCTGTQQACTPTHAKILASYDMSPLPFWKKLWVRVSMESVQM